MSICENQTIVVNNNSEPWPLSLSGAILAPRVNPSIKGPVSGIELLPLYQTPVSIFTTAGATFFADDTKLWLS